MTDCVLQFIACASSVERLGLCLLQVVAIKLIQLNFAIFLQILHLILAKKAKKQSPYNIAVFYLILGTIQQDLAIETVRLIFLIDLYFLHSTFNYTL